jgi:nitrate reductase gamma subunit
LTGAARHLAVHLGGALAATLAVCALPALLALHLGDSWAIVLLPLGLAPFAVIVLFVDKVAGWLAAPVPFRAPLTVGQQRGLPFLPRRPGDNPHTALEVAWRAVLDIVLLRPLFRATPTAPVLGRGLSHGRARPLWLGAVAFHASLAVVAFRHLRMVLEPVPLLVAWLEDFDVATEMILPKLHLTSIVLLAALLFLLGRRLALPRVRLISLCADYFPLFLLIAIATTGLLMRHVIRTDVGVVKQFALGLAAGQLVLPAQLDPWLLAHVCSVTALACYFPLGKLMHMPGVFLSPALTLANTSREARHINPRNPKVEVLHYADYEATFRERMREAGLPVEKE